MIRLKDGSFFNQNKCFEQGDVYISRSLNLITAPSDHCEIIDCEGMFITPGFTDIHIHGAFGYDVSDGNTEDLAALAKRLPLFGVTSFVPTAMALSPQKIRNVARAVSESISILSDSDDCYADILGLSLEGPFLSSLRAGAQHKGNLMTPQEGTDLIEELIDEYPGLIKIIDVAPELEGAYEFAEHFANKGIVISMGHTDCDYGQASGFIDKGAKSVTHMFNAMRPCSKREPNLPGAAFDKGIFAELICDGIHVDKTVLRMAFKLFGDKVITISDSMRAAGLGDGIFDLGGTEVRVTSGRAYVNNSNTLAGSVTDLDSEAVLLSGIGIDTGSIIASVTCAPNLLLGQKAPCVKPGNRADLLILDKDLRLKQVICKGHIIKI